MSMRPSQKTKAAEQSPRFEWDYEHNVPNDAFWSSFDRETSQAIFACYDTPPDCREYSYMTHTEKGKFLRTCLVNQLQALEHDAAPLPPYDVDHKAWRNLKHGICAIDKALGDVNAEERTANECYEHGPGGTKDVHCIHWLSYICEQQGRWAEAEVYGRQALEWIQGLEKLGPDSPQALGGMRSLIKCLWKQGKQEEAEEWADKCLASIERMGHGHFAKYREEELEELENVVDALERGE